MKDTYSEEANIPPSVPSARVGIGSKSNMGKHGDRSPFVISRNKRGRRLSLPLRHEQEQEQEQARTGRGGVIPSICIGKMGDFPPSSYHR